MPSLPLDLNFVVLSEQQTSAGLDIAILAYQQCHTDLDFLVIEKRPYRFVRLRKDLLTRYFGGQTSDANFPEVFDPPNPGAVVQQNIGDFSPGFNHLTYTVNNTIPSSGSYDKYSLPLSLSSASMLQNLGTRILTAFRFLTLGENSSLMFGLFNDTADPLTNISDGSLCAFAFETEGGHVWFRGWFGTTSSFLDLGSGLPLSYFTHRDMVVEMEIIAVGITYTMEFRLFLRDLDLDTPFASLRVTASAPPTVSWYGVTSIGRRFPWMPASEAMMQFEYVDIEPGTGVPYQVNPVTGLTFVDAKWRPYQDRPPIHLRAFGSNQVFAALSDDRVVSTVESSDTVLVDPNRPVIHVVKLETESPALVPYAVSPPIPKGSLQPGYSGVTLTWYATQPGVWSLRVNSTSPSNGVEIQNGRYDTPGIYAVTTWDYADLHGPDGTYSLALYLTNDAGMSSGNGLGEYLLPFQHKIGSAMDVSLSNQRGFLTDLSILIGPAAWLGMDVTVGETFDMMPGIDMFIKNIADASLDVAVAERRLMAPLSLDINKIYGIRASMDVSFTAYPIVLNKNFDLWTSPSHPNDWDTQNAQPGFLEVSQVGPAQGHGGGGTGAMNIWYGGSSPMIAVYQGGIFWLKIGDAYTLTFNISYYGYGGLRVSELSNQFGSQWFYAGGVKTINFIATSNQAGISFALWNYGNITIDSVDITKD